MWHASHVHVEESEEVQAKGLRAGTIGLFGATMMGLSSTAPVFSLAATIGLVAAVAGVQSAACMLVAFIPMLFVAYAYRELNTVVPDCGTTFTWASKAFGPHTGWMGGWAIVVTGIIFLFSLVPLLIAQTRFDEVFDTGYVPYRPEEWEHKSA